LAADDLDALDGIWRAAGDAMYAVALWRTGSREDAEDAVQDALIRVTRSRRRLHRVERPLGYLLTVVHRVAGEIGRRRRRERDSCAPFPELAFIRDPERDADAASACRRLAMLPDRQRVAVCLRLLLGLSFREIGTVTGVPTFTAASRFRLGLERLRRLLGVTP